MMEEEIVKGKFPVKDALITSVISILMGLSSFFSLFIALPLLNFGWKHSKRETGVVFAVDLIAVAVNSLYVMKGSSYYLFMVLMNLYIPVSLLAAGMIWTCTKGRKTDGRLILSFIPSLAIVLFCAVVLSTDRALFTSVYNGYRDAFVPVIEEMFQSIGVSVDEEMFFLVIMSAASLMMFPLVVGAACVSLFLFESVVHSREGDWDEKLYSIEFSEPLIWVLIAFLVITLLSRFISVPSVIFILSTSMLLALLILYGVQGFSVLYYWINIKERRMKSNTLFIILLITGLFIPGLNFVVLIGLPLVGILENFFDLKKRKEE